MSFGVPACLYADWQKKDILIIEYGPIGLRAVSVVTAIDLGKGWHDTKCEVACRFTSVHRHVSNPGPCPFGKERASEQERARARKSERERDREGQRGRERERERERFRVYTEKSKRRQRGKLSRRCGHGCRGPNAVGNAEQTGAPPAPSRRDAAGGCCDRALSDLRQGLTHSPPEKPSHPVGPVSFAAGWGGGGGGKKL